MVIALSNTISDWGHSPVIATRVVAADAEAIAAVVAGPGVQRRLIAGFSPMLRPSARVQGPSHPGFVRGVVRFGHRDALWLTWMLSPGPGTTEVDLIAQIESRSVLARLAMALGGRRWLRNHLDRTLAGLATLAHRAAEDLDGVERHDAVPAPVPTTVAGVLARSHWLGSSPR